MNAWIRQGKDKTAQESEKILKRVYDPLGMVYLEFYQPS